MLYLAVLTLLFVFLVGLQLLVGKRALRRLQDVLPLEGRLPRVSIVVAARNEERDIEPALASLLQLDYDNLQLIAVNDRSSDETGAILDRVAARDSRVQVVHLTELPQGWLGKNHALYRGAQRADGEWLLFTDADIIMQPSTLRRTMAYALQNHVDHLPLLFRVDMPNWLLESFVVVFTIFFTMFFRPWKVRDPKSKAHIGIGGFNLIRKAVYTAVGTHEKIAMRPDDDLKLGKIVKLHGFRQDVLIASEHVSVPWYATLGELIRGLEKNAFAGVEYQIWIVVLSSAVILAVDVFPFIAVFVTTGTTQWIYGAVVLMLWLLAVGSAVEGKFRWWTGLLFPVAVLLFVFVQWRTMVVNLWNNGIRWRDTHYSLAELKANKI